MIVLQNIGNGLIKISGQTYKKGTVSIQRIGTSETYFNVLRGNQVLNGLVPISGVQLQDATTFATVTDLIAWANASGGDGARNFYCGTVADTAIVLPIPAAPSGGTVDDNANTYGWVLSSGYNLAAHEMNILSAGWVNATNPIAIGNVAVGVGGIQIRVKQNAGVNQAGAIHTNTTGFTVAATLSRYFGFAPINGSVPTQLQIEAGTAQAASGAKTVSFPNQGDSDNPAHLYYAYPSTETDPSLYYISDLDTAALGPDGPFAAPVTVGPYRVIHTVYETSPAAPVTFS